MIGWPKAEAGTKDSFHARGWTAGKGQYMIRFGPHCWFFGGSTVMDYRYYPRSMFDD